MGEDTPANVWAPPDAAAAPTTSGDAMGWGSPHSVTTTGIPVAPVPALGLRPMTVADILDGGFAVIKARPRRILGFAALFVVPAELVPAFLERGALTGGSAVEIWTADPTLLDEQARTTTLELLGGVLELVLPAVALVAIAAALAHLVAGWSVGRDPSGAEMLGVVWRRWWALLASFVLVKLAEAVGLLGCYLGVVFVMPLFVSVAPVIGVEGGGPIEAMRRSWRLTARRYWPVLGTALLIGVVSGVVGLALSFLPQALAAWLGLESGWPLLALAGIAQSILMVPFVAAASVLLYLDLRVRTEGLDIELEAGRVFGSDPLGP